MEATLREGAARALPRRHSSLPRPLTRAPVTRRVRRSGSDEVSAETLDQPQAYAAAGLTRPPEDGAAPVEAAIPVAT